MVFIISGAQQQVVKRHGGYRAFVDALVMGRWDRRVDWDDVGGFVQAEIVRSSWRAGCPFCRGALVVEPGEPYFCPDCCMQGNYFRPMAVLFPAGRAAIELLLLRRPDPMTRNWLPHETIEDLIRENIAHGLEDL